MNTSDTSLRPIEHLRFVLAAVLVLGTTVACQSPAGATREAGGAASSVATGGDLTASQAGVESILAEARQDNQVMEHLRVLTKDIGPRLSSSRGLERAERWCRDQFTEWGLDARLESWGELPVGFERGPASGRIVGQDGALTFVTPSWTRGTTGPRRGAALLEPTLDVDALVDAEGQPIEKRSERRRAIAAAAEELAATYAGTLEGAWIVRRDKRPVRELRRAFDELCAAEGTAGEVRRGGSGDLLMGFGGLPESMEDVPAGVRVLLLQAHYEGLVAQLESGAELELEFDIDNELRPGPIPQHNVVADIKGSEFPEQFVIVQGHLDSWDVAEGACDNGTGVATAMEAARLMQAAGLTPRRTIRFVLYGGEEQGLFGSRGYVRDHEDELERISIVLNHDEGTNYLEGIHATYAMWDQFTEVFAPVRALDGTRPFRFEEVDGVRGGPSDHSPFANAGVPAFHWLQDSEGYNYIHHTQHDNFEMAKEGDQLHSAQVVALAAWGFANLDELVERTDAAPLARRRLGVGLDGTRITRVSKNGQAATVGLLADDRLLAIDGVEVSARGEISAALQRGGSVKLLRVARGSEELEFELDYTGAEDEAQRSARAARREAWALARE
ncbi:MAG: M20/M25/M40 family metallo-hydrolase [Planctomycetota bacterium]|nr:M20/M25/M40 family metallo-hydrolase [Planctomycetota bacterium]